ncbi:membrane protein insertase YidC [Pontibacter chinhatensis]|uniref:Membrane protein insertase YidC n=1 Tax=Pontibacter chinhatensis TaxID=1436961 RepID=A0A1I2MRS7_9BACT|nr:membrane protein insertase YidC [Pontibacter chinhatensis]SFF92066.1 YidC/Oxa1 family membrane protein insertase [Pontibacter chinhatensis]
MDRNQAIGFGLIAILLLAYSFFFGSTEPTQQTVQETAKVEQLQPTTAPAEADSLVQARRTAALGVFGAAGTGEESTTTLENNNIRVTFNTKGGQVEEVLLKNYKTYQGEPLILFDSESSTTDIAFTSNEGKRVQLSDLYFTPSEVQEVAAEDKKGKTITFRANIGNGQSIDQVYTLYDDNFMLGYKLNFNGLAQQVSGENLTFTWKDDLKQLERDLQHNRSKSTINFATVEDGYDYLSISESKETISLNEPVKWVANKQNFFTAGIIAGSQFSAARLTSSVDPADTTIVKTLASEILIPAKDVVSGNGGEFMFYFGPNDYKILKHIGYDFDKNLDLGWGIFSYVNKWLIIPAFDFLENYIGNYGIIIILLVLYIKTILFPLTYKSYLSMAKMKVLKPEIDAIKERNEGDMQKTQMETMKLYQEMGVNPLSGCIPMLLQIPILFAMFNFFPNSIELRQEAFLWADDLSTYDVFARLPFTIPFYGSHVSMFTLLMTASTILYTWSNNQINTMQGPMKFYSYLMPVIFMFVLNSFPAGLSFYYFVSNIVTFGQQAGIRYFVDETKIRTRLEENKDKRKEKKAKGGPSFTERMQEAMRQAQEREQQKRNKAKK